MFWCSILIFIIGEKFDIGSNDWEIVVEVGGIKCPECWLWLRLLLIDDGCFKCAKYQITVLSNGVKKYFLLENLQKFLELLQKNLL